MRTAREGQWSGCAWAASGSRAAANAGRAHSSNWRRGGEQGRAWVCVSVCICFWAAGLRWMAGMVLSPGIFGKRPPRRARGKRRPGWGGWGARLQGRRAPGGRRRLQWLSLASVGSLGVAVGGVAPGQGQGLLAAVAQGGEDLQAVLSQARGRQAHVQALAVQREGQQHGLGLAAIGQGDGSQRDGRETKTDRKSTRLNSSHT